MKAGILNWSFAVLAAVELRPLCETELRESRFPISCYRLIAIEVGGDVRLGSIDRYCRRWTKNQGDTRVLNKVKRSSFVSATCKSLVENQIDLLRYQQEP